MTAGNGLEAVGVGAAGMPDSIVVDGALPDIQAADLIRRVRAMEGSIKPQILISLVEVDVASIMRAKRAGAFAPGRRSRVLGVRQNH